MANEVALQLLTRPGDLVAAPSDAHMVTSEANAPAVLSGLRIESVAGTAPMPPLAAWERMAGRRGDTQNPRVSTFAIENSHNRAGGAVVDAAYTCELGQLAKRYGLHLMVDGARLFNAAVALGCEPRGTPGAGRRRHSQTAQCQASAGRDQRPASGTTR